MWESWSLHPPVPKEIKTNALATRLRLLWVKVLSILPFEAPTGTNHSFATAVKNMSEHDAPMGLWPSWEKASEVSVPFPYYIEFLSMVS